MFWTFVVIAGSLAGMVTILTGWLAIETVRIRRDPSYVPVSEPTSRPYDWEQDGM